MDCTSEHCDWNELHELMRYMVAPNRLASLWHRKRPDQYTIELSENVRDVDELYPKGTAELRDDLAWLLDRVPNSTLARSRPPNAGAEVSNAQQGGKAGG